MDVKYISSYNDFHVSSLGGDILDIRDVIGFFVGTKMWFVMRRSRVLFFCDLLW